jgi:hypothetical protein
MWLLTFHITFPTPPPSLFDQPNNSLPTPNPHTPHLYLLNHPPPQKKNKQTAGLSDMAVAGCFAGPTFNLLVGLGCSFLWKVLISGPFTLHFDQRAYISLSFLYLGLGLNLGIGYFSRFQLGRSLALPLLSLYAASLLLQIVLIALGLSSPEP